MGIIRPPLLMVLCRIPISEESATLTPLCKWGILAESLAASSLRVSCSNRLVVSLYLSLIHIFCDVLRNMNKMDKEIFNKAIQGYVKDPKKNIPNLMEYAKVLRMQKRVKELIGVWL